MYINSIYYILNSFHSSNLIFLRYVRFFRRKLRGKVCVWHL